VMRNRGYIKATVTFVNDSQLRIREFINGRLRETDYARAVWVVDLIKPATMYLAFFFHYYKLEVC